MTLERGFFRWWMALALVWVLGTSWLLWGDLLVDCNHLLAKHDVNAVADCDLDEMVAKAHPQSLWPIDVQLHAAEWISLPPLGILVIGCLGFGIARGFRRPFSN